MEHDIAGYSPKPIFPTHIVWNMELSSSGNRLLNVAKSDPKTNKLGKIQQTRKGLPGWS